MAETSQIQRIENRVDKPLASTIGVSTSGGMLITNVAQAMEVAKLMSISGSAVPAHVRNNPGTCLAIAIQAWEWSMNPYAVANKSYVVNDRLAYEAALYNAVVTRRAPIVGRLKVAYEGEGQSRRCTVSARLSDDAGGGEVDYQSPRFADINPKNSPLWKNDPDQQLFYFSVRSFVRRHFPDVMMGVYTVDEMQDAGAATFSAPTRQIAALDVSEVIGETSRVTSQPGGTSQTALQPNPQATSVTSQEPAIAEPTPAPAGEPEEWEKLVIIHSERNGCTTEESRTLLDVPAQQWGVTGIDQAPSAALTIILERVLKGQYAPKK